MDIRRKFQIGLGIVLLIIGLSANSSIWGAGVFMIIVGWFNICPSCRNGACNIDQKKKSDDLSE